MSMPDVLAGPWQPGSKLPAAFLELPEQLHGHVPHWLGEDTANVVRQFSEHNAWFDDQAQAWVGVVPGQARLAGFCRQQIVDGEPAAFFGFWEGVDDIAPHQALFKAFTEWARAQGAKRVYGPINFTTYGSYRLRLDGHDEPSFVGEPWNPAYYPALMEQLGFSLRHRYVSAFQDTEQVAATVAQDYLRIKPKLEQSVRFHTMTPAFWMEHLDELYGFVDDVFGNNFAYTPISRTAFESACGESFAQRFCPHASVLALGPDDRIAGFFLAFPDYSPLLRRGNVSRLNPADIRFETHAQTLPHPRLCLAKTGGVHPAYRGKGLFTALGCELSLRAKDRYELIGGVLMREDNPSSLFGQRHGTAGSRHYGLYQAAL